MNNQFKLIKTPTGKISSFLGEYGMLECLCVADYGKEANMHADFLGLHGDIHEVKSELMPLEEKMVITISTQYGCRSKCKFCDAPKVGAGMNVTDKDLNAQIAFMIALSGQYKTKRLNIHYARMGEPTFNLRLLPQARQLKDFTRKLIDADVVHPVVSTMLPNNNCILEPFLKEWCYIKNIDFGGDAGLQFSINSTDEVQRDDLFGGSSLNLFQISKLAETLPEPKGRKYTLNFPLFEGAHCDGYALSRLFNPEYWIVKITPIHAATEAKKNGYCDGEFVYKAAEESCKEHGFDVIVFIPSKDEEEGRITCGNVCLADGDGYANIQTW